MTARLPNFVIIGAQKSGTTSLLRSLAAHPDIFMPIAQVYFFDQHFERGTAWYANQFGVRAEALVGEKTAEYLFDPRVPERVEATVPQAKLIATLRNPVDRAYSHYWHNRTRGQEDLTFEQALAAEDSRIAQGAEQARTYSYVSRGRYVEQLDRFERWKTEDRLLVRLLDDFAQDPARVIRDILGFLGLDPDFSPPRRQTRRNRHMVFRSQRLRGPIQKLPMPLRRLAVRLNSRTIEYQPMRAATRRDLEAQFRDEIAKLEAWLGRDLSDWRSGTR